MTLAETQCRPPSPARGFLLARNALLVAVSSLPGGTILSLQPEDAVALLRRPCLYPHRARSAERKAKTLPYARRGKCSPPPPDFVLGLNGIISRGTEFRSATVLLVAV